MRGDDRRLRILFVTPSFAAGGAEKHLVRLVRGLDRRRFDLAVAVVSVGGPLEAELPDDVEVFALGRGKPWSMVVRGWSSSGRLRGVVGKWAPDLVCAVNDLAGVVTLRALRRAVADGEMSPRSVVLVQNAVLRKYGRARRLSARWFTGRWLATSMRHLLPRADRLVASSRGVAEELAEFLGPGNHDVEVIYNAGYERADVEAERHTKPSLASSGSRIVACGRLVEQKGFDVLIDALALLRRTVDARLRIVGEGPARRRLERQIRRLELDKVVHLTGFHPDPMTAMAQADLFVLSSRWEGFGNVVVEAMASGTPVVATDCPHGPGEIVEDGVSGVLVPAERSDLLASAMARVLGDAELAPRLVEAGRRRARDFSSGVAARRYGEIFERLCRGEDRVRDTG